MWQKIKTGLAIAGGVFVAIGLFLAGFFAGRKLPGAGLSPGILGGGSGNSLEASRHEAATVENVRRVTENIGQISQQNRSAAEDNRQASENLDGIRQDNSELAAIAEGLRRISNSGTPEPEK